MIRRLSAWSRVLPAVLLVGLAVAVVAEPPAWLRLGNPSGAAGARMSEAVADIPAAGSVLVGFDPDVGTYAEIRPTVRTVLDELAARGTSLTFVSLTAEGRALAAIERARLADASVVDGGFVTGAEAGLVRLARDVVDDHDAILVVGGNDLGPRSWVEQVLPRVANQPLLAVVPAVLLPEVRPYMVSGQLAAAITTPREGAEYRAAAGSDEPGPAAAGIVVALLAAIAVLLDGLARRFGLRIRAPRAGEAT